MRVVSVLATLVSCVSWAGMAAEAGEIGPLSQTVRPSVVEIIGTVEQTGDTSYGTGFVLFEPGLVVTNAHVLRGVRDAMIRTYEGALIASVDVLHVDTNADLAVLRVVGWRAPPLEIASGPPPDVGHPVVAVGHPRGYEFTVSNGIVSALRRLDPNGIELIQTTAPISPGSSGGPLLDLEGRVVGVCSLTLTEGQNINFAVPAREVGPIVDKALAIENSLADGRVEGLPAEALASLVREHRVAGDIARASALVQDALATHPRDLGLLVEAAEVAWSNGNYQEVDTLVERMQSIQPGFAPGQQIRAAYLAQMGRCDEAVESATTALEGALTSSQQAEAHAVLAECLGRLGDTKEALRHVESALLSAEIAALPDYHVLHAFLLQASGRGEEADLAAVAALQAARWDPLVVGALRERGLPRLLEILSYRRIVERDEVIVRGVLVNRGPVELSEVSVTAEGFDAGGVVVATGTGDCEPARLVPGQTGAFEVVLRGLPDEATRLEVRVVDYRE